MNERNTLVVHALLLVTALPACAGAKPKDEALDRQVAPVTTSAAYPLKVSANKRYLVDQTGAPFLMTGDSPQALMTAVSESDAEVYFTKRASQGFNTVWINLLCRNTGGEAWPTCRTDGSTLAGTRPFNTPGDFATRNQRYFDHAKRIIGLAANHHILVILDPVETISWLTAIHQNGKNKSYDLGKYIGGQFKNFDNIVWMSGNDYDYWRYQADDPAVRGIASGIKDGGAHQLQTVEVYHGSGGRNDSSIDAAAWISMIQFNAAYTTTDGLSYVQLLKDYSRATMPTFLVEGGYEVDWGALNALEMRRQEYWANLSGTTGQLMGNRDAVYFEGNWKTKLDSPGAKKMIHVKHVFEGRAWYRLVPDQNHTVVTSGYGSPGSADYVTAGRTLAGDLIMAYMPVRRPITVDMTMLSRAATARWFDPTNGAYTTIGTAPFSNTGMKTFTPTGKNAGGADDWVLILQSS